MHLDARWKYSVTRRRTTSGSAAATSAVDSTRSTNSTVASFRSMASVYGDGYACRGAATTRAEASLGSALVLEPGVFKAYDVRGIYGRELDEAGAYAVGRAYVEQFEPARIAVGRDMRIHAPVMQRAVIEGALDGGSDVLDIG